LVHYLGFFGRFVGKPVIILDPGGSRITLAANYSSNYFASAAQQAVIMTTLKYAEGVRGFSVRSNLN